MTEITTTLAEPPLQAPADPGPAAPIRPADMLMHFIVTLLAPMFLGVSKGDLALARLGAIEAVNAYRARNHADLIAVAQIIAYSMAAVGSLSLSMEDNLSLSMTLRLRGNANALNRSAEQNRRALGTHGETTLPQHAEMEEDEEDLSEAALLTSLQAARKLPKDTGVLPQQPAPPAAAVPIPATVPAVAPAPVAATALQAQIPTATSITAPAPSTQTTATPRSQAWATAMMDAAAQVTAGLRNLPPAERKIASMRAAALSSVATGLLSGNIQPSLDPVIRMPKQPPST